MASKENFLSAGKSKGSKRKRLMSARSAVAQPVGSAVAVSPAPPLSVKQIANPSSVSALPDDFHVRNLGLDVIGRMFNGMRIEAMRKFHDDREGKMAAQNAFVATLERYSKKILEMRREADRICGYSDPDDDVALSDADKKALFGILCQYSSTVDQFAGAAIKSERGLSDLAEESRTVTLPLVVHRWRWSEDGFRLSERTMQHFERVEARAKILKAAIALQQLPGSSSDGAPIGESTDVPRL